MSTVRTTNLQVVEQSYLFHKTVKNSEQVSLELSGTIVKRSTDRTDIHLHFNISLQYLTIMIQDVDHGGVKFSMLFS